MLAKVGDRLVLEGIRVGDHRRIGVITQLRHEDGSPLYLVRWLDDDHEVLVFPGPDAKVQPSTVQLSTMRPLTATRAQRPGGRAQPR